MGGAYSGETVHGEFRNSLAYGSKFAEMQFSDCPMARSDFKGSVFTDSAFLGCDISQCNFNSCTFRDVEFTDCVIDLSTFRAAIFERCKFTGGRAEYCDFGESSLAAVEFDIQLHGSDLRFASSIGVSYGDSNLWGATFSVSCNAFVEKKLSERQLSLFLLLLAKTSGNDLLRSSVLSLIRPEFVTMMKKLTAEG